MNNLIQAMIFGFKEILTWNTMRFALIGGTIISMLWIGIGIMLWDFIVAISSSLLGWIPFSMIRSNGAWMLSIFLWFQLVLLTFALVFAFAGNLILRTLPKEKYDSFSLWIAMASALFWSVVWFVKGDYIYEKFLELITWLPFETIDKGVAYMIGLYFIYNLIIASNVFATSFLSEPLLIAVEEKHCEGGDVERDQLFKTVGYTLKDSFIFLILSIIAFPLLFVPLVNILTQVALWMWLTKDTLGYDALALTSSKVTKESLKEHRLALWFISFISVLFNFVPLLNLFGPFFGEITMFYYLKKEKSKSSDLPR